MVVTTETLYKTAYGEYAIAHFNVANMEQIVGAFRGAAKAKAPFIAAFSRAARDYAHPEMLEGMVRSAHRLFPEAVFAIHLDHGDQRTCVEAIESGFYSSVMIDASHLPFDENITITKEIVERAHDRGISVEAELGVLAGMENNIAVHQNEAYFTDPDDAAEFIDRTGCDSLAVAVGTSHGAYKFQGNQSLQLDRLATIQKSMPGFPLVLHGASAIYPSEVERINACGGEIKPEAKGLDEAQLPEAIKRGVTKVNIGSDGRILWTRVHREFLKQHPDAFDFSEPGRIYMQEFAEMVAHKCKLLGSNGRIDQIQSKLIEFKHS